MTENAECWGDRELYTSSTIRPVEERLKSCPGDSHQGLCRQLKGCGKQLLNMSKSLSITLTEDVYQPVVSNTVEFWLHSQLLLGDQITASVQNNLSLPSLEYEVLTVCIRGCCGLCFCHLRMELSQIEPQYHLCMFRNKS